MGTGVRVPLVLVLPKLLVVAKRCHLMHGESLMFPVVQGAFCTFCHCKDLSPQLPRGTAWASRLSTW